MARRGWRADAARAHDRAMSTTAPAWFEITVAVIVFGGVLAFVVWAVVLWVVRLRFPPDAYSRIAPPGDDLVHEVLGPVRRVTREAAVPSAHQPAARRPAWRVPAGTRSSDATAVTFRMTARVGAGRIEGRRLRAGSASRDADGAKTSPGRTSAP